MENKKLQKSETCICEEVSTLTKINVKVAVKAKALPCWIFQNVPNVLVFWQEKDQKQNEPENPPRKEQGKEK